MTRKSPMLNMWLRNVFDINLSWPMQYNKLTNFCKNFKRKMFLTSDLIFSNLNHNKTAEKCKNIKNIKNYDNNNNKGQTISASKFTPVHYSIAMSLIMTTKRKLSHHSPAYTCFCFTLLHTVQPDTKHAFKLIKWELGSQQARYGNDGKN